MDQVFISHDSEDVGFVSLLAALLEFHGVSAWYSKVKLKPGARYIEEIDKALAQADSLLVVATRKAGKSQWVTREISTFVAGRKEPTVIPLMLEAMDLDEVFEGLSQYQGIDFATSLHVGFIDLHERLGKSFLGRQERRKGDDRRTAAGRRRVADRRVSPLPVRLRHGLWLAYEKKTGAGKRDPQSLNTHKLFQTIATLLPEASRYRFFDTAGIEHHSRVALQECADRAWEKLRLNPADIAICAVHITDTIADEMLERYEVKVASRRAVERRSEADRRTGKQ